MYSFTFDRTPMTCFAISLEKNAQTSDKKSNDSLIFGPIKTVEMEKTKCWNYAPTIKDAPPNVETHLRSWRTGCSTPSKVICSHHLRSFFNQRKIQHS